MIPFPARRIPAPRSFGIVAAPRLAAAVAQALILALPLITSPPTAAQTPGNGAATYDACTKLARSDPETAFERALAWRDAGGGAPAQHCVALALVGLGLFDEAARRLEALALDMLRGDDGLRAAALDQAGQAWLRAGNAERADAAFSAALDINPDDVETLIDRSLALAAQGAYWEAVDDLDRASDLAPERGDIYAFRASAYRFLDSLDLAADDIERALSRSPDDPVALLERGNIRRLRGDNAGARADWLRILTEVPDSPAAKAAQANLERMDVNVE